jgi:ketopantoate reductase
MDNHYSFEIHTDFVELNLNLDVHPSSEVLAQCWKDLVATCAQNTSRRVLTRLNIPLRNFSFHDIFEMASYLAVSISGLYIAIVLQDDDSEEVKEFFQLVASNRGLTVAFFHDYESAQQWISAS